MIQPVDFCSECGQTIGRDNDGELVHTASKPADHDAKQHKRGEPVAFEDMPPPKVTTMSMDQLRAILGHPDAKSSDKPYYPQGKPEPCHWCHKDCGGTCLGLQDSAQIKSNDPAYFLLKDGHKTSTNVYDSSCYICKDPEFAQMGLPLCRKCPNCYKTTGKDGHIPADDTICTICGHDEYEGVEDGYPVEG